MGFFDLLSELKNGEPDVKKAASTMKILGWGCVIAGVWNFVLPQTKPFQNNPVFHIPDYFPLTALVVFPTIGALFLLAARGIPQQEPWGKKVAQAALALLFAGVLFSFAAVLPAFAADFPPTTFKYVFYAFFPLAVFQLAVPAYYGYRYLGRLPVKDPFRRIAAPSPVSPPVKPVGPVGPSFSLHREFAYKDSPSPFGLFGTFALMMAICMGIVFSAVSFKSKILFLLAFFAGGGLFLGPVIFNYFTSPFEANRVLVAAFSGGGSIFLFNGGWPLFRLMVYKDALEVRVMLHRFLIPYHAMDDFPAELGFFSGGLAIKSNLSGVPGNIRFHGFGMKKILKVVRDTRREYLATAPQAPK